MLKENWVRAYEGVIVGHIGYSLKFLPGFVVRTDSRKMSDRKAELERKRKRLEEIKKAREEKKKVRLTGSKLLWFS